MRKMIHATALVVLSTVSAGCLKEELPVPARSQDPGTGAVPVIEQVCMGFLYGDQTWMDLETATVLSTNSFMAWDLAFESAADGWHVRLNSARVMGAWDLGAVDIEQPADTNGFGAGMRIDASSGNPDSTAIGDWRGSGHVYMVDKGISPLGARQGFVKIRFLEVDVASYTLQVAALNGSGLRTITVSKDHTRHNTHLHLTNGVVDIEPPKGTWDVVLTQYTYQYYEPETMLYVVRGMISAPGVRVSRMRPAPAAVTLGDTLTTPLNGALDVIGFDWKYYDIDQGTYYIRPDLIHIVQCASGRFVRLRFLDFYGPSGAAGCPQFEVMLMQE